VNAIAECTVPEKVLLAAYHLEETGQSPFSAEALVVAAWQKYPVAFGLKGFAQQYPDSNKVLTAIMGEKGLARKGWLAKMGQKLYALTREGRQVVRHLQQGDAPAPPSAGPVSLPKELERLLRDLFASAAWHKFREGRKSELTFADACRFWGLADGVVGDALDARLERVRADLTSAEVRIGLGRAVFGDGRSVSADDVGSLVDTHAFLEGRFSRHLTLLRTRARHS
jgi:hypothetical protein